MSWEEDRVEERKCPCNKGTFTETHSSDDWNRFRTSWVMNCPDYRVNYRLHEFAYYHDAMPEIRRCWVETATYDQAIAMNTRAVLLRSTSVANAKARYLYKLVQELSCLSNKENWSKLNKGLRHFSRLSTFYIHTKGAGKRAYIGNLFHYDQLAELLRGY